MGEPVPALRIGLLIVEGVTQEEIGPVRERLEALGARVTAIVPTGGPILPVSGRYYPAASGHAVRRPLSQVTSTDFDLLWVPSCLACAHLTLYPPLAVLLRGHAIDGTQAVIPLLTTAYLTVLLQQNISLAGLIRQEEPVCTVSTGGRRTL